MMLADAVRRLSCKRKYSAKRCLFLASDSFLSKAVYPKYSSICRAQVSQRASQPSNTSAMSFAVWVTSMCSRNATRIVFIVGEPNRTLSLRISPRKVCDRSMSQSPRYGTCLVVSLAETGPIAE